MRSRALWAPEFIGDSGGGPFITPSLVRTMALSSEPPRIRPMERRGSISDSKQKVRARERTWRKGFAIYEQFDLLLAD